MRVHEATTVIDASPDQVWNVLVDGAGWSTWDSGVTAVDGRIALGEKVSIHTAASPGRAFPVTVSTLDRPSRLVLRGGMPLGLFRGTRSYRLLPEPGGAVRFDMREEYTGPLAGLIFRSIPDLGPSFVRFANGLKRQVESSQG
jgi:uncharacterized protein YndB with AHSA1/START domain